MILTLTLKVGFPWQNQALTEVQAPASDPDLGLEKVLNACRKRKQKTRKRWDRKERWEDDRKHAKKEDKNLLFSESTTAIPGSMSPLSPTRTTAMRVDIIIMVQAPAAPPVHSPQSSQRDLS